MTEKKTILVGGYIGLFQSGGAVWDYIEYPLGLLRMGYDVYYLEDTMMYPVYSGEWNNSIPVIERLQNIMESFGLADRWIYVDEVTHSVYGKSEKEYHAICNRAEIFLNVSCANVSRDLYSGIPVRILLDSDPMFTQIQMVTSQSFTSDGSSLMDLAAWHTHHFTFGENIHHATCQIPETPFRWQVTRQPVCLDLWENDFIPDKKAPFTSLLNWKAGQPLLFNGQTWGQKDVTFPLILSVPGKSTPEMFCIALNIAPSGSGDREMKQIRDAGWKVVTSAEASKDPPTYRSFIVQSKAELSVAKETYVKAKTGWFSCRSACYLAAGRPVITQETGWSSYYPVGKGLFAFTCTEEAVEAVGEITSDWKLHSRHASEIAREFFDHAVVFKQMFALL